MVLSTAKTGSHRYISYWRSNGPLQEACCEHGRQMPDKGITFGHLPGSEIKRAHFL